MKGRQGIKPTEKCPAVINTRYGLNYKQNNKSERDLNGRYNDTTGWRRAKPKKGGRIKKKKKKREGM